MSVSPSYRVTLPSRIKVTLPLRGVSGQRCTMLTIRSCSLLRSPSRIITNLVPRDVVLGTKVLPGKHKSQG